MKFLVETTGDFMLVNGGFEYPEDRPCVPPEVNFFLQSRVTAGQVRVLGRVQDDATDGEFKSYFEECEGDSQMAVEAFLSAFGFEEASTKGLPIQITAEDDASGKPLEDDNKDEDLPPVESPQAPPTEPVKAPDPDPKDGKKADGKK